jgi:F-type H+-transporting ATPase subunit b
MEALGINAGFLIAQLINFGLVFWALRALLWKPLTAALDRRAEAIEKGLEDSRIAAEARANAEKDAEAIRNEARLEAQKLVAEARSKAEEAGKAVEVEASAEAERIRSEARASAEAERDRLLGEMRSQVISLAIAAANRLIGESLDQKKQTEIVNNFFSKAPDNVKGLGDHIEVVSALPLTDAEKNKVQKATGANQIDYKVDPELLGGLIIRAGDKVVDGSVRSGLSTLAARLN